MDNDFGEFLKSLRGDRSLREIERNYDVSHTYLSSLEKGFDPRTGKARQPTPDVLKKLSYAYDHDYLDLARRAGLISREEEERTRTEQFDRMFDPIGLVELLINSLKKAEKTSALQEKLNELIEMYPVLLGNNFEYTKEAFRSLGKRVSETGNRQFYNDFFHFFEDFNDILFELRSKPFGDNDLFYQIQNPLVLYKGRSLEEKHRNLLLAYLDALMGTQEEN